MMIVQFYYYPNTSKTIGTVKKKFEIETEKTEIFLQI